MLFQEAFHIRQLIVDLSLYLGECYESLIPPVLGSSATDLEHLGKNSIVQDDVLGICYLPKSELSHEFVYFLLQGAQAYQERGKYFLITFLHFLKFYS